MSLRGADVGGPHSRERAIARILAVAMLAVSLLAFVVPDGSALPHNAAQVSASHCQGKARRLRPGQVSFSFSCGESQDVTAFVVQANRTLHSVSDPSFAFGCQRSGSRSFDCEDITRAPVRKDPVSPRSPSRSATVTHTWLCGSPQLSTSTRNPAGRSR